MPEKLVDDNVLNLYKEGMDNMRETLGRKVLIHLPSETISCPNCLWDSVNECSAGVFGPDYPYPSGIVGPKPFKGRCPIYKGKGVLDSITRTKRVKGLCYWLSGPERELTVAGVTYYVDMEVSNVDIRYYELFEQAEYFEIDGKKVYLALVPLKEGLRDLIKFTAYLTYGKKSVGNS